MEVGAELLHGDLFAFAFLELNLFEHFDDVGVVFLFFVEGEQHHQYLVLVREEGSHLLGMCQCHVAHVVFEVE